MEGIETLQAVSPPLSLSTPTSILQELGYTKLNMFHILHVHSVFVKHIIKFPNLTCRTDVTHDEKKLTFLPLFC